jgi:hypothetical protein
VGGEAGGGAGEAAGGAGEAEEEEDYDEFPLVDGCLEIRCKIRIFVDVTTETPEHPPKRFASLREDLCKLQHDDSTSDFSIIVGNRHWKVHRLILTARCAVQPGSNFDG